MSASQFNEQYDGRFVQTRGELFKMIGKNQSESQHDYALRCTSLFLAEPVHSQEFLDVQTFVRAAQALLMTAVDAVKNDKKAFDEHPSNYARIVNVFQWYPLIAANLVANHRDEYPTMDIKSYADAAALAGAKRIDQITAVWPLLALLVADVKDSDSDVLPSQFTGDMLKDIRRKDALSESFRGQEGYENALAAVVKQFDGCVGLYAAQ